MRDRSNVPNRLLNWLRGSRDRGAAYLRGSRLANWKRRGPGSGPRKEFDFRNLQLSNVSEYAGWIRWGLAILAIFLLSEAVTGILGLFIRPSPLPAPSRRQEVARQQPVQKDYDAILRRNMFNVEGKIPDPLEQGQMDCMSQARPSTQRITLLGTLVMGDEKLSVALIQEEGNANKIGVKKDEVFFEKYQAMKVDRKRLCFQVRATQEFEYVEIPEQPGLNVGSPQLDARSGIEGITPTSETDYVVKKDFLDTNIGNLNEILQTARAVPYVEPGTGKFRGFLIQSIDTSSIFGKLGIRQGDVLTGVNEIVLDNAGKGLEAFQKLRNSNKISLEVIRSGQKTTMNYDVK